jgi:hypothetical protein
VSTSRTSRPGRSAFRTVTCVVEVDAVTAGSVKGARL